VLVLPGARGRRTSGAATPLHPREASLAGAWQRSSHFGASLSAFSHSERGAHTAATAQAWRGRSGLASRAASWRPWDSPAGIELAISRACLARMRCTIHHHLRKDHYEYLPRSARLAWNDVGWDARPRGALLYRGVGRAAGAGA
jgi:hypothetical protein